MNHNLLSPSRARAVLDRVTEIYLAGDESFPAGVRIVKRISTANPLTAEHVRQVILTESDATVCKIASEQFGAAANTPHGLANFLLKAG